MARPVPNDSSPPSPPSKSAQPVLPSNAGASLESNRCRRCNGSGVEQIPAHRLNITLGEIRKDTGLSWSMVSRVFSTDPAQRRSPSLKNARKIADSMGISIDLLHDLLES